MKGIQINNFFNNHISLNGKKNANKQPATFFQGNRPQPVLFSRNLNEEEPQQVASYDALTPQMKVFNKEGVVSARKKRTNTSDQINIKEKQKRKSKGKQSSSYQKFKKAASLDKYNQKQTSQQQQTSKTVHKPQKKPKTSRTRPQPNQPQGVKRSKSAIIRNINSKGIQSKQMSKQVSKHFLKQPKKSNNIISENSLKNTKKQLKKETQNLINSKQRTERVECKTARVQSTKVKERKMKDKIIAELQKSSQKEDKKQMKYNTEKKSVNNTASKSYLTTAKTSKPVSAREKKSSKKLFDSKEKNDQLKFQQGHHIFNKFQHLIQGQEDDQNQQVKQALHQLQQVLQGISSKKSVASELKKFAFKLKNIHSEENSQKDNSEQNSEEESNSDAFKKIKDFKNNLVKKKLNEANQQRKSQQKVVSSKKSSKKLLGKNKKLQDPHKRQEVIQTIHFDKKQIPNENDLSRGSEPDAFKNTESEQSRYINSKVGSDLYGQSIKKEQEKQSNQVLDEENSQNEILDQSNRKYMQFLKKLQAQNNHQMSNDKQIGLTQQQNKNQYTLVNKDNFIQRNDNLIDEINNYLNRQVPFANREYNSQNPKENLKSTEKDTNPMLQRRRGQCYEANKISSPGNNLKNYQSDSQDQNYCLDSQQNEKKYQIQQLKTFQKKSDQMMSKIGVTKVDNKKKGLTIELNRSIDQQQNPTQKKQHSSTRNKFQSLKSPSSPKFQDHYPRVLKSPKISDIQITNILAVKQKCLASKHEKMNELIQRMYEKELVSPKSYQYYTHQIRRQFEEESEGFDGFKEQASEILNQINREKEDIKAIDELIRQEKWQQARKLMKQDRKAASVFFGFKKSKDKVYESFSQQKQKAEIQQTMLQQTSPSKKFNIGVIQNNINITIKPSETKAVIPINEKNDKESISTVTHHKEKKQIFKGPPEGTNIQKGSLVREKRKLPDSDSEEDQSASQAESNSIAVKLDFEFSEKYRLKSNEDLNDQRPESSKLKLQQEFSDYLNVQKADSEDFQHYVYYQGDQNQKNLSSVSQNSNNEGELTSARLKQQNVIKLIEVSKGNDDLETVKQNNDRVIQIDQDQPVVQAKSSSFKLISVPTVEKDDLQQEEDNLSESDSILELELRKGFESNLFFIKQYCISLCEFIRDNGNKKSQFKTNITQPLEFDTIELLKKYRTTVNGDYNSNYNSSLTQLQYKTQYRKPVKKAISQELAREFNETYGPLKFWNVDLAKKGRAKFKMEKQTEAIFLAAILEVLNESLDFQRPGSIFGKPLIWANSSKHLKNMKYLNGQKTKKVSEDSQQSAQTYDFIFGVAIARIIQWGSCLCGFLPDTAELQNTEIDDDYVVHIRQTRMAFLLEKMLAQEQATFNNSELEETEIMLYLGKVIAQELVKEASQQIFNLNKSDSYES